MEATLDPAWTYDEGRLMLVRNLEFGRAYRHLSRVAESGALFAFLGEIGNIASFGGHSLYNINLNLRANSMQIMCKTPALAGISYQDLMIATKIDGMWWRSMQALEREKAKAAPTKQ
jgi:pterin-4a-carbinolamine dehydratase